jgi:hypothetical protein
MIDLLRSNHIMILSKTVARLVRQVMERSGRTPAPPASDAGIGRVSAAYQDDKPQRSEAIRRLVELGLAAGAKRVRGGAAK